MMVRQTSLSRSVVLSGAGVHGNQQAVMTLHPGDAHSGINFVRISEAGEPVLTAAKWSRVSATELCTAIGGPGPNNIATVEHLLSALAGLGVDNALIEIDGPEVPILDGSAADFVAAIDEAGIVELAAPRRSIEILKPVRVEIGRSFAELRPHHDAARGLALDVEIDFADSAIGRQRKALAMDPGTFRREIARARTFGFLADVERLWKAGFALGASLENTVAIAASRVVNPEGLRFRDEFVRHKILDAIGDLYLAGAPLIGTFHAFCPGHRLNHAVVQALFADASAWRWVGGTPALVPARHGAVRRDLGSRAQPAFAPDCD